MRSSTTSTQRSPRLAAIITSLFLLLGGPYVASPLYAAPCLDVGDIDFGTLAPSQSNSMKLKLCNQGSGEIAFQDPVVNWTSSEFSISQQDIEKLKHTTLGPNDCVTITVTFSSSTVGDYEDVAHFFVSAGGCKEHSTWTARVTKPGPFITGHHWDTQWLSSENQCTKNGTHDYVVDVVATNSGTKEFIVREAKLVGQDAADGIFYFDPNDPSSVQIDPGDMIQAGDPMTHFRTQRVHFKPMAEKSYKCTILLVTEDGDTASNVLLGTGIESDVAVESHDFGAVRFSGPEPPTVTQMVTINSGRSTRGTTLTGAYLTTGTDFSLTGHFFKSDGITPIMLPYTMALSEAISAEVQFHPQAATPAQKFDTLIVVGDFKECADSSGALAGTIINDAGVVERSADGATMRCAAEPNPFAAATTISFTLGAPSRANVEIFDAAGARMASLADEILDQGRHTLRWDAGDLPSGIYYCRIHAGARSITQPILLVR